MPGGSVGQAVAALDADPARQIKGSENLRAWMQDFADQTIAELDGTHFDIPEPARRIEAMIAPTSDGGIYYTGPSEDWSRPGRMWWTVPDGTEEFSTWKRDHDDLPRGCSRSPPPGQPGRLREGVAEPLAAPALLGVRAR